MLNYIYNSNRTLLTYDANITLGMFKLLYIKIIIKFTRSKHETMIWTKWTQYYVKPWTYRIGLIHPWQNLCNVRWLNIKLTRIINITKIAKINVSILRYIKCTSCASNYIISTFTLCLVVDWGSIIFKFQN